MQTKSRLLLLAIELILLLIIYYQHSALSQKAQKVAWLERENKRLTAEMEKLAALHTADKSPDFAPKPQGAAVAIPPAPSSAALLPQPVSGVTEPAGSDTWKAAQQLKSAEQFLAIDESQRQRLKEALEKGLASGKTSLENVIRSSLGDQAADEYAKRSRSEQEERDREDIEKEVAWLSRSLSLNSGQEESVRNAITQTRNEMSDLLAQIRQFGEDAETLHAAPEPGHLSLREKYEQMKKAVRQAQEEERIRLTAQLQGVLSDEQMNRLLEHQAKNLDPFFAQ